MAPACSCSETLHVGELETIGRLIYWPCGFIPALVFTFANLYTGRPIKWAVALAWVITAALIASGFAGASAQIAGVYVYAWGNIFKVTPSPFDYAVLVAWFWFMLWSCWILFAGAQRATSRLERRHYLYLTAGFLVVTFSILKALVTMGINIPYLLPLGMLLNDIFVCIIGVAIIKDQLFDITLIVEKGTLYSILAGVLIFVYSVSEHVLVTYVGETFGEQSELINLVSIAVAIAFLMPVKGRMERAIARRFAHRQLEF